MNNAEMLAKFKDFRPVDDSELSSWDELPFEEIRQMLGCDNPGAAAIGLAGFRDVVSMAAIASFPRSDGEECECARTSSIGYFPDAPLYSTPVLMFSTSALYVTSSGESYVKAYVVLVRDDRGLSTSLGGLWFIRNPLPQFQARDFSLCEKRDGFGPECCVKGRKEQQKRALEAREIA